MEAKSLIHFLVRNPCPPALAPATGPSGPRPATYRRSHRNLSLSSNGPEEVDVTRRRTGDGGPRGRASAPQRRQDQPSDTGGSANQLLIALLFVFSLIAISLLWSVGQRLDAWVFTSLNLRGYHSRWMDRAMWLTTQIGNAGFAALLAAVAYAWGNWRFAIELGLGTLTLWLLVELIKAFTDRARPFNLLRETRVIGWREAGLSFPSGHTA